MSIKNGSAVYPLQKFMDVTGKYLNNGCGSSLTVSEFAYNFIWSHKFEAEVTSQGWIGISLKVSKGYTNNMALVVWIISPSALSIDKFHQVERVNLS